MSSPKGRPIGIGPGKSNGKARLKAIVSCTAIKTDSVPTAGVSNVYKTIDFNDVTLDTSIDVVFSRKDYFATWW